MPKCPKCGEEIDSLNAFSTEENKQEVTRANKEFWFGFLVALADFKIISTDDWRDLRNMVDGW